jgi:hypothetical protein
MQGFVISMLIALVVGLINWFTTGMFVVGVISFAIVGVAILGPLIHLCRMVK